MSLFAEWPRTKLQNVVTEMRSGFAQRPNVDNIGTPQLRTNNISPEGFLDLTSLVRVKASAQELTRYGLRQGDVLFNNTNSEQWVGKTAYYDLAGPFVLSNHMTLIRADRNILDPEFLALYLHHVWKQGLSRRFAKRWVNQAAIDQAALAQYDIPLPPIPEQQRIAAILRQAETVRSSRGEALVLANRLLPALFYEMFGDPIVNERQWPSCPMKMLGKVLTGNTPSRTRRDYYGDDIEWVKSDNLDTLTDFVAPAKEHLSSSGARIARTAQRGATLITCIAGSPEAIGKARLADRDVSFNQQINAVIPHPDIPAHYLYAALRLLQPAIQSMSSGGMKGIVTKTQIEKLSVITPPKDLQRQFDVRAFALLSSKAILARAYQQTDTLLTALMTRAFTGELTIRWREERAEELARAAEARDAALRARKEQQATARETVILSPEVPTSFAETSQRMLEPLDALTLEILETAPTYFRLEDLLGNGLRQIGNDRSRAQTEEALRLLTALGFVRQVRLQGQEVYRRTIWERDQIEKPESLQEGGA